MIQLTLYFAGRALPAARQPPDLGTSSFTRAPRDSTDEGLSALRLKLPEDYASPPHDHPQPEIGTVLSGTFYVGMGETADRDEAEALPAGSFFALSPGMPHYAFTDEETVIQLNSTGPWQLNYVDPEGDPREES